LNIKFNDTKNNTSSVKVNNHEFKGSETVALYLFRQLNLDNDHELVFYDILESIRLNQKVNNKLLAQVNAKSLD